MIRLFYHRKFIAIFTLLLFSVHSYSQCEEYKDSVKIHFRQGKHILDYSVGNNRRVLQDIADKFPLSNTDSLYNLVGVTVIGGASPEGSVTLNKRLSEKRAKVLFNYLSQYSALSVLSNKLVFLGRDWKGLLQLVTNDENVPYRNDVIELLEDIINKVENGEGDSEQQLERLCSLHAGKPYRYMYRVLFTKLRASQVILSYQKITNPFHVLPYTSNIDSASFNIVLPDSIWIPAPSTSLPHKRTFNMAIKTNMLADILLVPNIGVEFDLGKNYSVSANIHYAWWNTKSWFWRTYGGELAFRKWFGRASESRPLTGHHLGIYSQALTYDFLAFGTKGYMSGDPGQSLFDRAVFSVGIEYGYSLPIAKRLNIDFVIGVGYQGGKYNEYQYIDDCYVWQNLKKRNFFGPTKAEISLVWLLGNSSKNGGVR